MLILTRNVGESIVIGEGPDAITITILDNQNGRQVRLGVDGPRHVPVWRSEIKERMDSGTPRPPRVVPL